VARTRDRQRALARAKLDRQIARRAAAARRRRQIQAGTAAGLALVLVVLGALWFSGFFEPDPDKPTSAADCAWNDAPGENTKDVGRPPTTDIPKDGVQTMTITTNQGVIRATVDTAAAPCAAASFSYLASKTFFDNTKCHRLTTEGGFVLQCGDPTPDPTGNGGPGYRFADENLPTADPAASDGASAEPSASASAGPALYKAGMIAMANSGPDTNGSQFFIVYKDSPVFEAKYTVLGRITSGLDIVENIAKGGVIEGSGTSATDGKPKTEVTIQTLTMSAAEPAPAASTDPSGSAPAGTSTAPSQPSQ
jgi:peptidyl-prolyl cis-trans isomerase B (cyclophilin B)